MNITMSKAKEEFIIKYRPSLGHYKVNPEYRTFESDLNGLLEQVAKEQRRMCAFSMEVQSSLTFSNLHRAVRDCPLVTDKP